MDDKKVFMNINVTDKYPGIKFAYIIVENIIITKTPPRQKKLNRSEERVFMDKYNITTLENNPNIISWKKLFEEMGIIKKCQPAQYLLAYKVLKGIPIPKINNIVDLANLFALKSLLPVGAFDWGKIQGFVELRLSKSGEIYTALFENQFTTIPEGEIVYSDEIGIFSRYNKDADRTKISEETKSVFFVIDATDIVTSKELLSWQEEMIKTLKMVVDAEFSIRKKGIIQ